MYNIVLGQNNKSSHSCLATHIVEFVLFTLLVCAYDVIKELYGLCEIYLGNAIIVSLSCNTK